MPPIRIAELHTQQGISREIAIVTFAHSAATLSDDNSKMIGRSSDVAGACLLDPTIWKHCGSSSLKSNTSKHRDTRDATSHLMFLDDTPHIHLSLSRCLVVN
jgi:hypothetical protein